MLYIDYLVGSGWPIVNPRYRPIEITGMASDGRLFIRRPFFKHDLKKPHLQSVADTAFFLDESQQLLLKQILNGRNSFPLKLQCAYGENNSSDEDDSEDDATVDMSEE